MAARRRRRIVDAMTSDIANIGLPTLHYDRTTETLTSSMRRSLRPRRQGPIALGPYGPEVLSYDLVRTVLRDSRFVIPKGIGLVSAGHHVRTGLGSGHQTAAQPRRRRAPAASPARREGVHPTRRRTDAQRMRRRHHRAGRQARRAGPLRLRRRYRQAVSGSDHLCAARRTARGLELFSALDR